MRDRPEDEDFETRPDAVVPLRQGYRKEPGLRNQRPEDQGDRLRAWLVSGGQATWEGLPYAVPAETDGVQLLSTYYVPEGQTGYIKQIRAAPFKPSVLANAVNVELVPGIGALPGLSAMHSDSSAGFWTTPFGWEGYNAELDGEIPRWLWHLRFIPGDIARIREGLNIPPFSFLDPLSWFLVPNIPVPASGYPNGLPGSTPGSQWGPQRLQRLGSWEEGQVQIVVPADTTIALFAEWSQGFYRPTYLSTTGAGPTVLPFFVFALGPSFGSLEGYIQVANSVAGQVAAREGWNS